MVAEGGRLDGFIGGVGVVPHVGGLGHVPEHVHRFPQGAVRPGELQTSEVFMVFRGKAQGRLEMEGTQSRWKGKVIPDLEGRLVGRQGYEKAEGIVGMAESPRPCVNGRTVVVPVDLALVGQP